MSANINFCKLFNHTFLEIILKTKTGTTFRTVFYLMSIKLLPSSVGGKIKKKKKKKKKKKTNLKGM